MTHRKKNAIKNLREVVLIERKYTDRHYWYPLPKKDVSMYEGFYQNPDGNLDVLTNNDAKK